MSKSKKQYLIIFGILWLITAVGAGIFPTLRESLLVVAGVFMGNVFCMYFNVPDKNVIEYEQKIDGITTKAKITGIDKRNAEDIISIIKLHLK